MRSAVSEAVTGFLEGRVKPEHVVIAVAAEYYRDSRNGNRETLQPLIDVIDRASPGIVELGIVSGGAGFEIRLAERPFPRQYEPELRRAAEAVLSGCGIRDAGCVNSAAAAHPASRITHLVSWIRRLFRAPSA